MSELLMDSIAQRILVALASDDVTEFSDLLHPDVRWGAPGDPNPGCRNRNQVIAWYQRGREAGVRAEVTECLVHDAHILIGTRIRGNEHADEAGGAVDRWQVFSVVNGQIVEIAGFDDRPEALALAAG